MSWDIPYPKVAVCKRPHYEIHYEQVGPHTYIHVAVHTSWTRQVKREFERDCDALQEQLGGPVFVLCDNAKLFKFCTLFGFKPVCSTATAGGEPAMILIRKYNE
jgi:hypothetical protein